MYKTSLVKAVELNGILPGSFQRKPLAFGVEDMFDIMVDVYNHTNNAAQ